MGDPSSSAYRYSKFSPDHYEMEVFHGPRAGGPALDFRARTLDGEKVFLSDFFGAPIVLTMGSFTCPIYQSRVRAMNQLMSDFPDVQFLLLYVREAHPGENLSQHRSMDEKISCARKVRDQDGERRIILVDDLDGSAHRLYGAMPNSVYIIGSSAKIVFRGDWNQVGVVREVLESGDFVTPRMNDRFSTSLNKSGSRLKSLVQSFRVLRRGGWRAIWDFVKSAPFFMKKLMSEKLNSGC